MPAASAPTTTGLSACSEAIEARPRSAGVTLTMGGEPTFVPCHPEGAEWATAALGPTKLGHARRCAHAFIQRARPGAVILETCSLFAVRLSGYAPPADPALPTIGFPSDPGVLEINLSPEADWPAFDRQLHALYAAADDAGLCARKFQLNGRLVGTGGGCHLVFGGPTPEGSPFFTHPHLLPSVIRYWQHHPALSYAFSGQIPRPRFAGPPHRRINL